MWCGEERDAANLSGRCRTLLAHRPGRVLPPRYGGNRRPVNDDGLMMVTPDQADEPSVISYRTNHYFKCVAADELTVYWFYVTFFFVHD